MRSFGVIFLVVLCSICTFAEPPRKRFNFRSFGRQEAAEGESEQPQGYNYEAPVESRRLRLPAKFRLRAFARQEEQSGGYNYPKPTEAYGPPEDGKTTTEPSTEYGTPQTDSPQTDDSSTDSTFEPDTTTNPQAETLRSLQATQVRRQNAKLARIQTAARVGKQKQFQQVRSQVSVIEQQPIYFVQYPHQYEDFVDEPELVYFFKK